MSITEIGTRIDGGGIMVDTGIGNIGMIEKTGDMITTKSGIIMAIMTNTEAGILIIEPAITFT
jgi:hypothetical protein